MRRAIIFLILFIQFFSSSKETKAQILIPEELPFLTEPALMRSKNNKMWVIHFVRMYQGFFVYSVSSKSGNSWQNYPLLTLAAAGGKAPKFSDIVVFNNKIYVSGMFGFPFSNKNCIATLEIGAGNWTSSFEFFLNGGVPSVNSMAIADNRLFVGGLFQKSNGIECLNMAQISKINVVSPVKIKTNNGASGMITGLASDSSGKTLFIGGNYRKILGKITSGLATFSPADSVLTGFTSNYFNVYSLKNTGKYMVIWVDRDSTKNKKLMTYANGKLEDLPEPDSIVNLSNVFDFQGQLHACGNFIYNGNRINGILRLTGSPEHVYSRFTRIEDAECFSETIFVSGLFFNPYTANNELFRLARINDDFKRFAGRVYYDVNGNNKFDAGEPRIGGRNVKISPWNVLIPVDKNGVFTFIIPKSKPTVLSLTPQGFDNALSAGFDLKFQADTFTEKLVDLPVKFQKTGYSDVQVQLTAATGWKTRLDTSELYQITITNNGLVPANPDVNLNFNSKIIKVTPNPAPDVINPGKITWTNELINPGEEKTYTIKLVAPSADFGQSTAIDFSAALSNLTDDNTSNNTDSLNQQPASGIDNVIKFQYPSAQTGEDFAWLTPGIPALEYIIRFTNSSYDTVETVIVRDTVSIPEFVTFLQETGSSHSFSRSVYTNPNLPNKVILVYTFQNIKLPPSNGNAEVSGSSGYIGFKLGLAPVLSNGTEITNTAWVYMDGMTPQITNTVNAKVALNHVSDIGKQNHVVFPNPFNNEIRFRIPATTAEFKLFNTEGKLLITTMLTPDNCCVKTPNLTAGTYIYTLKTLNQEIFRGIIQKSND